MGTKWFILVSPFSAYFTYSLAKFKAVSIVLILFTYLRKRNKQSKKYKNWVDFCRLSPYLKDASEMKREQILWGLQYKYLFWPARAKLTIFAADCVLTFHVSRPRQLSEGASSLRLSCVSSTDCPYCYAVLNADGRVHTVTCVRLFYLFLT